MIPFTVTTSGGRAHAQAAARTVVSASTKRAADAESRFAQSVERIRALSRKDPEALPENAGTRAHATRVCGGAEAGAETEAETEAGPDRNKSSPSDCIRNPTTTTPARAEMVQSRTPHQERWTTIMRAYLHTHPGFPCSIDARPRARRRWAFDTNASPLPAPPVETTVRESRIRSLYWVPVAELGPSFSDEAWYQKDLIMRPTGAHNEHAAPRVLYRYHRDTSDKEWLGMPPMYGQCRFGPAHRDQRAHGQALAAGASLDRTRGLDDLQRHARDATLRDCARFGGSTQTLACGSGKTALMTSIMHALGRKTLLVVPKDLILRMWLHGVFSTHTEAEYDAAVQRGEIPLSQGRPWMFGVTCTELRGQYIPEDQKASKKRRAQQQLAFETADVVITTVQTLYMSMFPPAFLNTFGTVVFDEVHHMNKPKYSLVLEHLPMRYRVGMSATPHREDGTTLALYYTIGPLSFFYERTSALTGLRNLMHVVCVGMTPRDEWRDLSRKFTDTRRRFQEKQAQQKSQSATYDWTVLAQMSAMDPLRTHLVAVLVTYVIRYAIRNKVVVFTEYCDQCLRMARTLQAAMGGTVPILFSEMSTKEHWAALRHLYDDVPETPTKKNVEAFQQRMYELVFSPDTPVFIGTDKFLDEGFNCPDIDCVVLASDLKNVKQHLGRTQRPQAGKQTPLCLDVYCNFSPWMSRARGRQALYKELGFQVDTVSVPYVASSDASLPSLDECVREGPALLFNMHPTVPVQEAYDIWAALRRALLHTKPIEAVQHATASHVPPTTRI